MELKFDVYAKIDRPVADVFDAVVNPERLSAYFTTGGASAALAEGATVLWKFADCPGEFPVRVSRLVPNERIEFGQKAPRLINVRLDRVRRHQPDLTANEARVG